MSAFPDSNTPSTGYAGAVDHYLSPDRHDAVRVRWEEPAIRRVFDDAVSHLQLDGPLRVLDIGCGTGDGLALLRSAPQNRHRTRAPGSVDYTGLDLNEDLLSAARRLHQEDDHVRFVYGDVRDGLPAGTFDLFLSCGAPYSHLTRTELELVLGNMFTAARSAPRPVAVVVDVLGRYSIEWTTQWDRERWPYRMSFFRSDKIAESTDMTCYSGTDLRTVIRNAADQADCPLSGIDCYDRSIMVGHHTVTSEFTPNLRPYRRLVNDLVSPDIDVDIDQLLFDVTLPDAPPPITSFFHNFSLSWNTLIAQFRDLSYAMSHYGRIPDPDRIGHDYDHAAAVLQPMLACGLERMEALKQSGLGVGHSLTAVAYTQPS